jgi:hypothetical protein
MMMMMMMEEEEEEEYIFRHVSKNRVDYTDFR